jgi:hypothetical protein
MIQESCDFNRVNVQTNSILHTLRSQSDKHDKTSGSTPIDGMKNRFQILLPSFLVSLVIGGSLSRS